MIAALHRISHSDRDLTERCNNILVACPEKPTFVCFHCRHTCEGSKKNMFHHFIVHRGGMVFARRTANRWLRRFFISFNKQLGYNSRGTGGALVTKLCSFVHIFNPVQQKSKRGGTFVLPESY